LKTVRGKINQCHDKESEREKDNPVTQIVTILNNHLDSLKWVENTSNEIKEKLMRAESASRNTFSNGV